MFLTTNPSENPHYIRNIWKTNLSKLAKKDDTKALYAEFQTMIPRGKATHNIRAIPMDCF